MSVEENRALIRRGVEEGCNKGNVDVFDEIAADDVVNHIYKAYGLEAFKQHILAGMTAFPDVQMTVEDMIAEGDKVVVRHTFLGTQQGEIQGAHRLAST